MIKINRLDTRKWKEIEEVHYNFYKKKIKKKLENSRNAIKSQQRELNLETDELITKYIEIIEYIIKKDKEFFSTLEGMQDFIKKYQSEFEPLILERGINKIDETLNWSEEEKKKHSVNKIFDYNIMNKKISNITHRHKIISMMGVTVCPYCQRQYITNYENGKKTTADLDHHYPQILYPFLALSLYNFIPSCQICNSRMKGKKDTKNSIYLYLEDFDDLGAKFQTSASIVTELLDGGSKFFVEIKNCKDNQKVTKAIEIFKLNEVYKTSHNDYIKEMLCNIEKYPASYLESITNIFNNSDKENLRDHFEELIKKPYKDKIEKGEPLAKLTKDILEEFNIKI